MSFLFLNQIFILLINVFAISIGIFVFKNNSQKNINAALGMMVIFMLVWVDFAYIARLISFQNVELSLFFLKIAWFATPLLFTSLYFLIINLLKKNEEHKKINIIVLIAGILSAFMAGFNDFVVESIRFVDSSMGINYGDGMIFFLALITFIMVATLYVFFKEYFKATSSLKLKLQYFLLGITLFYSANLAFNITLPLFFDIVRFYWMGDYSAIILLSFIAYAIIKKELFDIKVMLTSVFMILIATLLLLDVFFSVGNLWQITIKSIILIVFLVFGWQLVKSIIREIDQRKKLENAYDELRQLDHAKSEFMSIVSHQLRTPLSIIKGHLSMVDEGVYDKNPRKRKKVLRNVYKANERLINLVNDVLSASRIQSGKIEVVRRENNVVDIVGGVVERFENNAEEKGVKLKFKSPKGPILANIDYSKIENSFLNLLDNAIKYTSEGVVEVSIKDEVDYFEIKIKDTGDGMTKQEINKLFKTFSRGSAGKRYWVQGSGLGLYIARQFAEMHGGKVWATSKGENQGSSFYIKIPKD
ncbi:MAG: ATP-binding protein [Patescibacteria group bacterium]|nr:ATP-binding protein [Patescibacteria group bacterium]